MRPRHAAAATTEQPPRAAADAAADADASPSRQSSSGSTRRSTEDCSPDERLRRSVQAYEDRSASLNQSATRRYTLLWDLGGLCGSAAQATSAWLPWALLGTCRPRRPPPAPSGPAAGRAELALLREEVDKQLWACWEADSSGAEVEVAMLSGQSWRFSLGASARGREVRERVARLAGLPAAEIRLTCGGSVVADDEPVLNSHRAELLGPPPQMHAVRVAAQRALSCSTDCLLKLWDLERGRCVQTMQGHGDGVTSLAADWGTRWALSGSHDCTLRLWDLDHQICVQTIPCPDHPAFCLAFDHGAGRALTGSWDASVKLWDLGRSACLRTLRGHTGMVTCVAMQWSRRRALSGCSDGALMAWDLDSGQRTALLEGHEDRVLALDVDWAARRALSGSADHTLRLWSLDDASCVATLRGHTGPVSCAALCDQSGQAVSGSHDRCVRLWDTLAGACLRSFDHAEAVVSLSADWALRKFLTACKDSMRLWDMDSTECVQSLAGHLDRQFNVSVGHVEAATKVLLSSSTARAVA